MALIDKYLVDTTGSFDQDESETVLEWLVYSDVILDYAKRIVKQGEIAPGSPLIVDGKAAGWYSHGTPYSLGNDSDEDIFAGKVEVFERKIIRGKGDFTIQNLEIVGIFDPLHPLVQWRVRQTYSSKNDEAINSEPSVDDKFLVSVSYEWVDVPLDVDMVTLQPVVNSAGLPFSTPAFRRKKIPVISMTRKEYGNPVHKALQYSNTVDGEYLIDSIIPQFDGKIWTVTYNVKINAEGWLDLIMDTGYHYKDPVNGWIFPILNSGDGTPISEPARLNGHGVPVPENSNDVYNVGPFHKYSLSSIADLKIPDPCSIIAVPPL